MIEQWFMWMNMSSELQCQERHWMDLNHVLLKTKKKKNCLCNYTIQNTQWGIQQLLKNLAASTHR